jgi:hypothetical protein
MGDVSYNKRNNERRKHEEEWKGIIKLKREKSEECEIFSKSICS